MATKYLFAVNPGSNTVSMFSIKPSDPLHPVLVGNPADTLGDFPMSVAYSSSLSMGKYGESFYIIMHLRYRVAAVSILI
jgi:hypothetical protein